jgi:D-beta-D-heptose 7-phosphate kinase/D-beta-D-heptose 1-phosphate adenosyltransferase
MRRKPKKKKKILVAVSGGFDPIHVGHVRLFEEARKLGDKLVVILNNDNWLRKKKKHVFMREEERKEIIAALSAVDEVVFTKHPENPEDMSVCHALENLRPDIFAQGGDRNRQDGLDPTSSQNPEVKLCEKLGIQIVYNVGHGGKLQSSSWLLANYVKATNSQKKPHAEEA